MDHGGGHRRQLPAHLDQVAIAVVAHQLHRRQIPHRLADLFARSSHLQGANQQLLVVFVGAPAVENDDAALLALFLDGHRYQQLLTHRHRPEKLDPGAVGDRAQARQLGAGKGGEQCCRPHRLAGAMGEHRGIEGRRVEIDEIEVSRHRRPGLHVLGAESAHQGSGFADPDFVKCPVLDHLGHVAPSEGQRERQPHGRRRGLPRPQRARTTVTGTRYPTTR